MMIRTVCQVKSGTEYVLATWNYQESRWDIGEERYNEPVPGIPMMAEGWVTQYLSDVWSWMYRGVPYTQNENPVHEPIMGYG